MNSDSLLTATAIITGFTFASALHVWSISIDARQTERYAFDPDALGLIDGMKEKLLLTAFVGLIATAWLGMILVFTKTWPYVAAVGVGLVSALLVLAAESLLSLYRASFLLR